MTHSDTIYPEYDLYSAIRDYSEENGVSVSEAYKRLTRQSLREEGYDV